MPFWPAFSGSAETNFGFDQRLRCLLVTIVRFQEGDGRGWVKRQGGVLGSKGCISFQSQRIEVVYENGSIEHV